MATVARRHVSSDGSESITLAEQTSKSGPAIFEDAVAGSGSDFENGSTLDEVDPAWTENTDVPRRRMGIVQVASLVINNTMDLSMLSLPGSVLSLTGSKPMGIALWVIVGFYTMLSAVMFVEFSSAYPYTGGPFIWLDEIFHHPAMLASLVFAWYWVLIGTTVTVCQNTALALLSLAGWSDTADEGFIRLTTVFVLTVICLSLYFARRVCFAFMSLFAALKVSFLFAVFIASMSTAVKRNAQAQGGLHDFTEKHPSNGSGMAALSGLIYVSFSYQGWEHTNYIAGEIKNPRKSLRKGVFFGLGVAWVIYVLATVGMYAALSYDEIVNPDLIQYKTLSTYFVHQIFGETQGTEVMSAMASFSCGLAIVYTMAKVKQAIAWQRIIPFYKFIGRQDRQFDSPGGALLLHWVVTVIQLSSVASFGSALQFWGMLYVYGYQIELGVLAIGLLLLQKRMRVHNQRWKFQNIPSKWLLYVLVFILVGFNILVCVQVAMDKTVEIPNWWMAVAMGAIFGCAAIHWSILTLLRTRGRDGRTYGERFFGVEVKLHICGDDESELSDSLRALMLEARADGTRRRAEYKLHGRMKSAVEKSSDYVSLVMRWLE